jgi:hypothetical protein
MAGDIKLKYAAATTTVTTTALQSLASSQTWIAGWGSNNVANTTNVYFDYLYGFQFTTASANRQATGQINVYVIGNFNDTTTYPAVSSGTLGTEGAISFADTFRRDSLVRPIFSINVGENGNGTIYTMPATGIAQFFGGVCPPNHCLYIAQNVTTTTTAGLASSGNVVYYTPIINQYT